MLIVSLNPLVALTLPCSSTNCIPLSIPCEEVVHAEYTWKKVHMGKMKIRPTYTYILYLSTHKQNNKINAVSVENRAEFEGN